MMVSEMMWMVGLVSFFSSVLVLFLVSSMLLMVLIMWILVFGWLFSL